MERHRDLYEEILGVGVVAARGHLTTCGKSRNARPDFVDDRDARFGGRIPGKAVELVGMG